ncbi:Clavaminate synthase-like protein [Lophiostoma macrostomum CBS 122681]|uniref:Clavaminate synthase-like protein n=1 Tax=Lophiostoma macrostomum CBS 122681 TaxID=1314788 RepID=A0A6A6TJH9_9PLEO|nr:Clavaminate synthase-like protein [Lophiostoma macrostomum CBS 122681]
MAYTGPNDHGSHIDTGIGGIRKIQTSPSGASGTFSSIPIIDLTDATSPSLEARKKVAQHIYDACVNVGFFYIKNHGVEEEVIEGVKHEAKRFFHDLSDDDKMQLDISKNTEFYGYAPIRANNTGAQTKKRMFESINFGYEPSMDPGASGTADNGPSFWPSEEKLPSFKDNVGKYYSAVMGLSRQLLHLFALALNLEETFFDQYCKKPGVLLKLNHYPAAIPESADNSGIHAHSDLESFTILLQDSVSSLEVLSKDGVWIPADPIPGTFVVNIGDAMSMWTNDLFLSTIHRAYNEEGKVRYSVPFFFGADYDAVMETLPSCIDEARPLKYSPITAGEHVRMKLSMTYPKDGVGSGKAGEKVGGGVEVLAA